MKKQQKLIIVLAVIIIFLLTAVFLPRLLSAGDLEPSGPPGPTMHSLEDIYNKLDTLNKNIRNKLLTIESKIDTLMPQLPRFSDQMDGTVLDTTTGLIWLKWANCFEPMSWDDAMATAATLNGSKNQCKLTDASVPSDWRLPTKDEFMSLIDTSYTNPALCNTMCSDQWAEGDPFVGVQSSKYWTSTSVPLSDNMVYIVNLSTGEMIQSEKTYEDPHAPLPGDPPLNYLYHVWFVRDKSIK